MTVEGLYNIAKDLGKDKEEFLVFNHNSSQYVSFESNFTEVDVVYIDITIKDYS